MGGRGELSTERSKRQLTKEGRTFKERYRSYIRRWGGEQQKGVGKGGGKEPGHFRGLEKACFNPENGKRIAMEDWGLTGGDTKILSSSGTGGGAGFRGIQKKQQVTTDVMA